MPSKVIAATGDHRGLREPGTAPLWCEGRAALSPGADMTSCETFYAEPDTDNAGVPKTARIFCRVQESIPHARQTPSAFLHRDPPCGDWQPSQKSAHRARAFYEMRNTADDVAALLKYYTTTLNYVGSLAKGSRVRQSLNDVATTVRPGGRELNVEYHSSRSTSAEVADVVPPRREPTELGRREFSRRTGGHET